MARQQHYEFVHTVLRDTALTDPLMFVWAARLPDGAQKLRNIFTKCAALGEPSIPNSALAVWVDARPPLCKVVVSLPRPQEIGEAYFAAALVSVSPELIAKLDREQAPLPARDALDRTLKALIGSTSSSEREALHVPVRFFTLERSVDLDGRERTALCSWERDDDGFRHLNLGDGPRPGREDFVEAIARQLR
jgi:hypothetical protein